MTQNARILEILSDGREHGHHEFYGFCVAHSRIAELRALGHQIEYRRDGDQHFYRLISLSDGAAEPLGPDGAPSPSESGGALPSSPALVPEQLTVWSEAAA